MKVALLIKNNFYEYHYEGKVERVKYTNHTVNHRVFESKEYIHHLAESTVKEFIHEIPVNNETTMD